MKNSVKLLAIIALVAVIGFSMTACDLFEKEDEEEIISLQGKWDGGSNFYEFTGENFRAFRSGTGTARGTFTYTATHITFNPTQYYSGSEWIEWDASSLYALSFKSLNIDGNPVSYRIESKNNSGVWLYIGSSSSGYKKQ
jgi:hypothetical protein